MLAETFGSLIIAAAGKESFTVVASDFTLTNAIIGSSLGICGALLAWYRPRHPVGWLFILAGAAQGSTALAAVILAEGVRAGHSNHELAWAATMFSWGWPWAMGLAFPVAMLLFPSGRPLSPRWRKIIVIGAIAGVGFVLMTGLDPTSSRFDGTHLVPHWGAWSHYQAISGVWASVGILNVASPFAVLVSLGQRYRRGDEADRRQLLWVAFAVLAVIIVAVPVVVLHRGSALLIGAIALVPAAVLIAVLRHNLLDIRVVVSRTLSWGLLTAILLVCYLLAVSVLGHLLIGRADALVAAAALALAVNPLRQRIQAQIDRLLFGDRSNPLKVLSRVAPVLGVEDGFNELAAAIATSLQLPYVAIRAEGRDLAVVGETPIAAQIVPLDGGEETTGELVVGPRVGQSALGRSDRAALEVLRTPVALAVRSLMLTEQLEESRERILVARDAERRRLRRDLHDGLGPVLASVAFRADAARNSVESRGSEATSLIDTLRGEVDVALAEVRRLVQALRPTALDEVGFRDAIAALGTRFTHRADGALLAIDFDLSATLPALPEAVETTAYRIVTEALTNISRHAQASSATVEIWADTHLHLRVTDDAPPGAEWTPGVGLMSMRERAAEIGGSATAMATDVGGQVRAILPLTLAG
ncbi:MAG: sensor histidine kinase [Marmoricola sp.]